MASQNNSLCFGRLPEEIRLLQNAEVISDYPKQLLRGVQKEILSYHRLGAQLSETIHTSVSELTEQQINDLLLQRQLLQLTVEQALRVKRAYHLQRRSLLQRMAVQAFGQWEAFAADLLEKLSDSEQQELRDFCEEEALQREQRAWAFASCQGRFRSDVDR